MYAVIKSNVLISFEIFNKLYIGGTITHSLALLVLPHSIFWHCPVQNYKLPDGNIRSELEPMLLNGMQVWCRQHWRLLFDR